MQIYADICRYMQIYAVIVCFAAGICLTLSNLKIFVGFCRSMQVNVDICRYMQ
jgi:hypothetical protein